MPTKTVDVNDLTFDTPKRSLTVENWPAANERVTANFGVLCDDAGRERAIRWTTRQPKLLPRSYDWVRFVRGSNSRHYVVALDCDSDRMLLYSASFTHEPIQLDEWGAAYNQLLSEFNVDELYWNNRPN